MKKILFTSLTIIMVIFAFSCNAQQANNKAQKNDPSDKVEVYYFHLTARCITCKTVEEQAKANVQSLYGNKISFKSVNLDDDSSKEIAEKLKVSGQALLVVKGEKQINLTNEGFMYARKNPEKFKSVMKEKIDPLL
jgi:uncharacterized membrane protein YhiD involved in acid resistance